MTNVNLQLCENNKSKMFVTVWAAVIKISTGKSMTCNAGHEHPAVRRAGKLFKLLKYKHNMFLDVSKKARYQNREFEVCPCDCLFVYTGGVPESQNKSGELLDEARLIQALNQNPDAGPEELLDDVWNTTEGFAEAVA